MYFLYLKICSQLNGQIEKQKEKYQNKIESIQVDTSDFYYAKNKSNYKLIIIFKTYFINSRDNMLIFVEKKFSNMIFQWFIMIEWKISCLLNRIIVFVFI